ncbi:DUF544 domain [Cordyceps militaris]|uniref:DUF544 domain n=1 Tax=Cordyceps militaris TaxID=73501 RepID=A0A2H4SE17_CORMI|nr:DUF544 domain [Cordyceps militaris]
MVSFQTSGDSPTAAPASLPTPPSPASVLQPLHEATTSTTTTAEGDKKPTQSITRIPSILRPGGGKSTGSNPFRNREGAASQAPPTEALSKMHLDSATNNPWGPALYAQPTGMTSVSDDARVPHMSPPVLPPEFQQDPWGKHNAVELDATSYTHPLQPLSVPTPEEQSVWGGESQNVTKNQADSQGTLVKPADDFSHIFGDQQAWDDLGRTPKIKRSATNKTAGGDSDQDEWNMIDSEASSIAGDATLNTPAVPKSSAPSTGAEKGSAATVFEAPATPWDELTSEHGQRMNEATTTTAVESKDEAPESPPIPTLTEQKNEPQLHPPLIEPIGYEPPTQPSQPQHLPQIDVPLIEPIGYEPPIQPSQSQHAPQITGLLVSEKDERPALPPRQPEPSQRWATTRRPVDGQAETYQIKNISWVDPSSSKSRVSPILVQNENGPCPLVALVNALSLTTPADTSETTLVQVLRSRERVSLNLLLDAVFDELMSPGRTSSDDALPDISELYEFLQSLHTGMNVNPRFIPTEEMMAAYKHSSLTHLDPTDRDGLMPGTFENSLEMRLYATFSIPLIHGWLPAKTDPAYEAFERQAPSYEDAQNLLFREEELEAKLSDSSGVGLTEAEQQLYQDIVTIKMFMEESATQLTPWGIEVIGRAMRPGTFAILFRNDHFSTLYCHPHTMQLLTLVTDAGYCSHDDVVWESLEDVHGELSAMYSGEFYPAGSPNPAGPSSSNSHAWTPVQTRRSGKNRQEEPVSSPGGSGDAHEQEDRDLALALQLQEEEEHNQREELERRRRESRLSEQFIEQQGRQRPQPVARDNMGAARLRPSTGNSEFRRSSSNVNVSVSSPGGGRRSSSIHTASSSPPPPQPPRPQTQNVRPLVPPRAAATTATTGLRPAGRPPVSRPAVETGEEAPPSYEAAQHDRRYEPGQGEASAPVSMPPAGISGGGRRTEEVRPQPTPGMYGPGNPGVRPLRPVLGGRVSQGSYRDRDRDCLLM